MRLASRTLFLLVGITSSSALPAAANVTAAFTLPAANQGFAVATPIQYAGTIDWTSQNTPVWPSGVFVEYVYSTTSSPPPGIRMVLFSEWESLTPCSFSPPPPQNPTSGTGGFTAQSPTSIVASQYHGSISDYWLRATPFWKGTRPYIIPGTNPGQVYYITEALGKIN